MTFQKGNPWRLKPKYTEETMRQIGKALDSKADVIEIFNLIEKLHPKTDIRTKYAWIEKAAKMRS